MDCRASAIFAGLLMNTLLVGTNGVHILYAY